MTQCGRKKRGCGRCERPLGFDFTMAFQPIVDVRRATIVGYEALVRGINGESAATILARVDDTNRYVFDQACRVRALERAHALGLTGILSINFLPNAVYDPEACIQATLEKADEVGWPVERLAFEIVETEAVRDRAHLQQIVNTYRALGFITALDDFGSGYANLDLLADLRPSRIKIDRCLIADVTNRPRQATVVESLIALAQRLDIGVIAEGVETAAEANWLVARNVVWHQGYYYARPALEPPTTIDVATLARIDRPQPERAFAMDERLSARPSIVCDAY